MPAAGGRWLKLDCCPSACNLPARDRLLVRNQPILAYLQQSREPGAGGCSCKHRAVALDRAARPPRRFGWSCMLLERTARPCSSRRLPSPSLPPAAPCSFRLAHLACGTRPFLPAQTGRPSQHTAAAGGPRRSRLALATSHASGAGGCAGPRVCVCTPHRQAGGLQPLIWHAVWVMQTHSNTRPAPLAQGARQRGRRRRHQRPLPPLPAASRRPPCPSSSCSPTMTQ